MERVGACEVGKVDGGTACWGPVLVSGARSGLTSVRRVKRTSVLKERCKRTFVEMPRMNRKDATTQRHANVSTRMLFFVHAYLCTFIHSYGETRAPVGANMMPVTSVKFPELPSIAVFRGKCFCNSQGMHVVCCRLASHDTRAESLTAPSMEANYRLFWIQVSVTNGENIANEKVSAPSLGCVGQMTMSWCVCQPMETFQCLGGDTRAVFSRLGWA